VRSGARRPADALAAAAREQAALLPQGLATPGHHIWTVRADGSPVGHVWLAVRGAPTGGRQAHLFDVEVAPEARGRGLGRAAVLAAEEAALGLGAGRMTLNVFAHNTPARRLYDALGYAVSLTFLTWPVATAAYDGPADVALERRAQVNPGHEVWIAQRAGRDLGSVCLHTAVRSDGAHLEGHGLTTVGDADGVVAAVQRHAVARGAVTVDLAVAGAPTVPACERAGFRVTAEQREKPLPG
jgi:GNAT superfamily N-acetyltransferase